ncbi:adenosylcobinamide-GDP ribazoletransferase [Agrobacterium sp. rho-8.1]|nr:adenosylcobinamide-GDP ribazoletransferase [Agrobacterium sp. rho-8.1]
MRTGNYLTDIMRSLAFLSRIPVHDVFFEDDHRSIAQSSRVFPLAGILIAIPSACVAAILVSNDADPLLSAALVLTIATLITGALHEDGLADTADGFGGGSSKERALEIMRDSRIGTYGAIALILSFVLRVAALAALMRELSALGIAISLIAVACLSRGAMVWHWQSLAPARPSGVAASAGQPDETQRTGALGYGFGIAGVIAMNYYSPFPFVIALAAPLAATYLFNRYCNHKIHGHTGDTIGATQQITEIVMLAGLALIV